MTKTFHDAFNKGQIIKFDTLLFSFIWNNGKPLIAKNMTKNMNKLLTLLTLNQQVLMNFLLNHCFFNDVFKIGGQHISTEYADWMQTCISTVSDILKCKGSLKIELKNQFNIVILRLKYNKIVSSIKQMSSSIETTPVTASSIKTFCLKKLNEISSQQIDCQLIKHLYQAPTSQNKWEEYYPFLDTINWKSFYLLPGKIIRATYLLSLQYKILHRVYNCRHKLFLWKIIESPNCL